MIKFCVVVLLLEKVRTNTEDVKILAGKLHKGERHKKKGDNSWKGIIALCYE